MFSGKVGDFPPTPVASPRSPGTPPAGVSLLRHRPFNPRTRLARHMRRYREPLSVAARPNIGIAAVPPVAVCRGVAGACVDDRDISENAHLDFVHRKTADRHRSSGLCEELFLVDERPVRVRAQEVLGQDLVEPLYIAMLHRMDVVV